MHQNVFGVRLRPHPLGELMCCLDPVATIGGLLLCGGRGESPLGELMCSLDPVATIGGPTSMRREGRKPTYKGRWNGATSKGDGMEERGYRKIGGGNPPKSRWVE